MSTLVSTASPEKMDRNTKLRATSGTINIHQQGSLLGWHKKERSIILIGDQIEMGLKDSIQYRKQKMFDSPRLHIVSFFYFLKELSVTSPILW